MGEDTEYARAYSEQKFIALEVGATEAEVLRELGEPLWRTDYPPAPRTWVYSQSPSRSNYRVRAVHFIDGKVSEKAAYFYGD